MAPVEGQLALFEVDALGQPTSTPEVPSAERDSTSPNALVRPRRQAHRRGPIASPSETLATNRLLSPEDVARRCGLSRKAVYRAVARGELRAARILSRLRIDPRDVEGWIQANVVAANDLVLAPAPTRLPAAAGLRRLLPEP
jgi:excisionase family DNA binding protein